MALGTLAIDNLASVFAHSFGTILTVRLVAGLGEGAGFALMSAAVSRLSNPSLLYGVFTVLLLLLGGAIQYSVPWLKGTFGIEDVTVVAGGNAKSVDMGQITRDAFLKTFASEIALAAART